MGKVTVEPAVCSRLELGVVGPRVVVELPGAVTELVRALVELVWLLRAVEELVEVVVELPSVAEDPPLPRTIPCSMKYWAEGSVPMMSSPKNPKPTTVPFLN